MESVHVGFPAIVQSYDYKTQKASVLPAIKKRYIHGEVISQPIITNVPVIFPRTARSGITFPIKKGDSVLIKICERSLERWLSSGEEVEPGDPRKFDLNDAVAIPGLYSFNQENIATNNDDLEVIHDDQKIVIKKNGDIEIGGSNVKKLVNEEFKDVFNNHGHDYASPGGPLISGRPVTGIASTSPPTLLTDSELTSKVKAQ